MRAKEISAVGIYPRNVKDDDYDPSGNRGLNEEASGLNYVVAAAAQKHKAVVPHYKPGIGIDNVVRKITDESPNVLLMSIDTLMLPNAQEIIKKVRKQTDSLTVIGGGSHFTNGQFEEGFDFIIRGEGELTLIELLDQLSLYEEDFSKINGLSYKIYGNSVINPPRARNRDLDSLPFPYRNDELADNKIPGSLLLPALENQRGLASITASRGCFYDCSFCPNEQLWGTGKSAVVYRSVDNVIKELKYLRKRFETNLVFFNDLNITSNKEWMNEFCDKKVELDKEGKVFWYGMSNISTARDQKMLKRMQEAGCSRLMFGVETIDPNQLQKVSGGYEKKYQSLLRTREVLEMSQNAGIFNHGFLMIGLLEDTPESIRRTISQIRNLPLHSIRVSTNTPFVGTRDYVRYKITDDKLEHHDGAHLIFEHPNLTEQDNQQLRYEIYSGFYDSSEYRKRMQYFFRINPLAEKAFTSFVNSNIVTRNLIRRV